MEHSPEQGEGVMPINGRGQSGSGQERRNMRNDRKPKALAEARNFDSRNPFFTVVMRSSYVRAHSSMYIPSKFAKVHLPNQPHTVTLEFSDGQKWPVKCCIRPNIAVLSKGWETVVLKNNIEEGDVCVFELIEKEKMGFRVIIYRSDEEGQNISAKKRKS